jgi:hypothetical protein
MADRQQHPHLAAGGQRAPECRVMAHLLITDDTVTIDMSRGLVSRQQPPRQTSEYLPRTRRRRSCDSRSPSSPPVTAGQPPPESCVVHVPAKMGLTEPVRPAASAIRDMVSIRGAAIRRGNDRRHPGSFPVARTGATPTRSRP